MKIRVKIFLFIFITSLIVFAIIIGLIVFRYRNDALKEAERLADSYASRAAQSVKSTLEKDLGVTQTLSKAFQGYNRVPERIRQSIYQDILGNVLKGNPEYLAVWMSWELRFIDPNYKIPYGRQRTVVIKESGNLKLIVDTVEIDGDIPGSIYHNQKISMKDLLTNPYFYSPEEGGDSILETSVAAPIIKDGEFAGVTGIDITLSRFQNMTDQISPFENSYAFLLANNGTIISFPEEKNAGDNLIKVFPEFTKHEVMEKIREGKAFSFEYEDSTAYSNYVSFAPVKVGNTNTPWSICLIAPTKKVDEEAIANFNESLGIGLFGLLIFSLITLIIAQRITLPLKQSTSILKDLDKGIIDFSKKVSARSNDELAEMARSLNQLMTTLNETANFAKKIGQGDFTAGYKALSDKDVLGNALIDMKNNLQKAQEQEDIRILEQKKLSWAQEGISELGDVLRKSTENLEEYLFNIISKVVNYLKAEQGGIFLLNDDDPEKPFLELRTAFAYDHKKVLKANIEIGESLVGRCFQEKELIHLTNLPDGYTFISSGLGGHDPKSLLLLPLMFENETFGVIEIASLHTFADFEIDFLRSIGERIASSISAASRNLKTKDLLEKYQIQSEEIQQREQAIQENLIELQKVQKEASMKETETEGVIDALTEMGSVVWYDMNGTILKIKDPNIYDAGLTEVEMIGHNQNEFAPEAKEDPENYKKFWNDLRAGFSRKRLFKTETEKGTLWISEIYTPIKDPKGKPYKVINIGFNISEQKTLEEKINKLQKEIEELKS
ncbi:MAG: GAF domain-containing protein [Bacteroidota bacterium]